MVESTVDSTPVKNTYAGWVKVTRSTLKNRNVKKCIINVPASMPIPAGDWYIIMSKKNNTVESTVDSTKLIGAAKRLYELFTTHADRWVRSLSDSEVAELNALKEVLGNE